jgi:hypothetical protein
MKRRAVRALPAASEVADADSHLRLGSIVSAARLVFGGFFVLGEQAQVHLRVVDCASSRVLVSDQLTGELATLAQQVQPLNRRLARALGAADSRA